MIRKTDTPTAAFSRESMRATSWRTLAILGGWSIVIAIVWLSISPTPPEIHVPNGDKFEHALAYGVLMLWFCQLNPGWKRRAGYGLLWVGLGIALEFVQRWLGYRTFDVLDMAADGVGVLLGWSIAAALPLLPGRSR